MHILPFGFSTGDFGFCQTDWASIDPSLATERDLCVAAKEYTLIADGIYNHISLEHPLAKEFCSSPDQNQELFYVTCQTDAPPAPHSPKGGSSQVKIRGRNGEIWWYWQTFPPGTIDVNLNNPIILEELDRHQNLLKKLGITCLRLDAPAYYGKDYGHNGLREHNRNSIELVRKIVRRSQNIFSRIIAQLDLGEVSDMYLSDASLRKVISLDYSFSALIVHALHKGDVRQLVSHFKKFNLSGSNALRPLRTHDGIYLRSENLDINVKQELLQWAEQEKLNLRVVDDDPYEINNSLGFTLSKISPEAPNNFRLELAVLATLLSPGHPYIYFPALLGWMPEASDSKFSDFNDPRAGNRIRIPEEFIEVAKNKSFHRRLKILLEVSSRIRSDETVSENISWQYAQDQQNNGLVKIVAKNFICYLNFSGVAFGEIPVTNRFEAQLSRGFDGKLLGPLGYILWVI